MSSCSSERDGLAGGLSHCDSEILVSSVFCLKDLKIPHFQMIDGKKSGELPVGSFYAHHFCSHSVGQNCLKAMPSLQRRLGNVVQPSIRGKKS